MTNAQKTIHALIVDGASSEKKIARLAGFTLNQTRALLTGMLFAGHVVSLNGKLFGKVTNNLGHTFLLGN